MPRILGACLARHFLRKLISRLFLGPGVDLESGENAAEKALLAASMIESVIHPLHLYILYIHKTSTTYSSVCFFFLMRWCSRPTFCILAAIGWLFEDVNQLKNFQLQCARSPTGILRCSFIIFYLQDKMAMQEHEMRGQVLPFQLNLNLNNTYTEILFQLIPSLSLIWDRLPPHDKGCTAAIRSVDSLKSATGLGSWECRQSK